MHPTSITELLNMKLPIIGAPMFLISNPELVVAVSKAGGIGAFPAFNYRTLEELDEVIGEIKKTTPSLAVNIVLHKEKNPNWSKQIDVCMKHRVNAIIFSLGIPRSVIQDLKQHDVRVLCDVVSLRQAKIVARAGADALIAVSQGAGGHAGAISPMSFIPYLKEEIGLPVIAAGSVSTGRQMAAAFVLGADAVYLGTRLIATHEAKASQAYLDLILSQGPESIVYTDALSGIHGNFFKQSIEKWEQQKGSDTSNNKPWRDLYSAGHGIAQIKSIEHVSTIIENMMKDYQQIMGEFAESPDY